jgi:hypothetical protein
MRCSSSGASCGLGMYGSTTTVERGSGPTSLNLMPCPSWCQGRAVACTRSSRSRSRALSTLTVSSPRRSAPRACHTNPGDWRRNHPSRGQSAAPRRVAPPRGSAARQLGGGGASAPRSPGAAAPTPPVRPVEDRAAASMSSPALVNDEGEVVRDRFAAAVHGDRSANHGADGAFRHGERAPAGPARDTARRRHLVAL